MTATRPSPLIAHILYRLDVGGLENGVVNLINNIAPDQFRHAIICITDYSSFRDRIVTPGVEVIALNKPPGNSLKAQGRALSVLRSLRPDIVHSRNLAALECQFAATLAGTPVRIHSEHGRDADDADGNNWKRLLVRRAMRPFVHHYIALSKDLEGYLLHRVGVAREHLSQIYNGVDTARFHPATGVREAPWPPGFANQDSVVVGTVGRMDPVKDPLNLVRGFAVAARMMPDARSRLRLVMVGDGDLRAEAKQILRAEGLDAQAWLPGTLDAVPAALRCMDVFVLPSLGEGISNTILEAMATGLPVIATRTGGNPELVTDGVTGALVPRADSEALALAIVDYVRQPELRRAQGHEGLKAVRAHFSLKAMVGNYAGLYRRLLNDREPHASVQHGTKIGQ